MNETKLQVRYDQHMWCNVVQMLEEYGTVVLVRTAWKCGCSLQGPIDSMGSHTMSARFCWASTDPHKSGDNNPGQWWLSTKWEPLTTTDIRLFMTNKEKQNQSKHQLTMKTKGFFHSAPQHQSNTWERKGYERVDDFYSPSHSTSNSILHRWDEGGGDLESEWFTYGIKV